MKIHAYLDFIPFAKERKLVWFLRGFVAWWALPSRDICFMFRMSWDMLALGVNMECTCLLLLKIKTCGIRFEIHRAWTYRSHATWAIRSFVLHFKSPVKELIDFQICTWIFEHMYRWEIYPSILHVFRWGEYLLLSKSHADMPHSVMPTIESVHSPVSHVFQSLLMWGCVNEIPDNENGLHVDLEVDGW